MTEQTPTDGGRRWTGVAGSAVRIVIGLGLIALLVVRTDIPEALATLRTSRPAFLALAALLFLALFAVCNWRWSILLRSRGIRISWPYLFRVYLASNALNAILPTSLGGDVLRVLRTQNLAGTPVALSVVLVDRALGLLALLLFSSIGVLLLPRIDRGLMIVNMVALAAVAVATLVVLWEPAYRLTRSLLARVRILHAGAALAGALDSVRAFRRPRSVIGAGLALSLAVWLLHCLTWYALGLGLGCTTPVGYYFAFVPLVALATMIPISIGGVGIRENWFAILMTRAGMPATQATTVALLLLLLIYAYALVGAIILLGLRRAGLNGPTEKTG